MSVEWTAPLVTRGEPDRIAPERAALDGLLDAQRETFMHKCEGLTAEQLKRLAVPPSALSLLGLVRHITECERWWFRMHAAGEDIEFLYDPDEIGADFNDLADADAAANLAAYWDEVEVCRTALAAKDLDDVVPSRRPDSDRTYDVRWIYLHMIDEYARHTGHADLLRESIDGTVGE